MEKEEALGQVASERPRLLDRVRDAIRRRRYSPRTEERYLDWIRRFIYFSGKRHPGRARGRRGDRLSQ